MAGVEEQRPQSVYDVSGKEIRGGILLECEDCGEPSALHTATEILYQPNYLGRILGYEPYSEWIIGSHSGCSGRRVVAE